jgi:hypothetical protein
VDVAEQQIEQLHSRVEEIENALESVINYWRNGWCGGISRVIDDAEAVLKKAPPPCN